MICCFLEGLEPDFQGRYLSDIWAFSDDEIEITHDFIQWLFPLDEPSNAVWDAPILIDREIEEVRRSVKARENLIRSQGWFLRFLSNNDSWVTPRNHNQRRVSRMVKSLKLLHSDAAAVNCLEAVIDLASQRNFSDACVINYWEGLLN